MLVGLLLGVGIGLVLAYALRVGRKPKPLAAKSTVPKLEAMANDRVVILAVATEWGSGFGGLSTFNRELCTALAKLGHEVYCGVPRLRDAEVAAARSVNVNLVAPADGPGEIEEAINRPFQKLPKHVDVVIGHARVTGGAALAQVGYLGGVPKSIHFVHMDPLAIEWAKKVDDPSRDASRIARERVDAEVAIGEHATLIVAVGPELAGAYATYFHHIPRDVHEFLPGLTASDWDQPPSPDQRCLVFGRAEDQELKGINFAADAMRLVVETDATRLAWLAILGAEKGRADHLRDALELRAGKKLRITVDEFNADRIFVTNAIRQASLVMMPSREEGFGLTGLEAISEGVPVLLSRTSGLAQAIEIRLPTLPRSYVIDVQDGPEPTADQIVRRLLAPDAQQDAHDLRDAMHPVFNWNRSAEELIAQLRRVAGSPGDPPIPPPRRGNVRAEVRETLRAASTALLSWRRTLKANDEWLDRPELNKLLAHAEESVGSLVMLGAPGSGKSALLGRLAAILLAKDWSVLAIKADRLPRTVRTREDLRKELALPTDLPRALRAASELGRTALIIDQLDALGDLVDEETERLSVLLDVVAEVVRDGTVPVLLSCRTFDFDHDVRFQRLQAVKVELAAPQQSEIDRALAASSVDPRTLSQRLKQLLTTPQALDAYLQLEPAKRGAPVDTHQQLLELLWDQRVEGRDAADTERRETASRQLAELMARREELWLDRRIIDDEGLREIAEALIESGLLVQEGRRVGFAHQMLFDFGRARSFLANNSLSTYVKAKQDALFVRPTLWTTLGYLRAVDLSTYQVELDALWFDQGIRPHIRSMLIEFIGQVSAPAVREQELMVPTLRDQRWRATAIEAIANRRSWFELLRETQLPALMEEAPHEMVRLLLYALAFAADDVLVLIERHWVPDPTQHELAARVLQDVTSWTERAQALALALVRAGVAPHIVDYLAQAALEDAPALAPKIIAAELIRKRDEIKEVDRRDGFARLLNNGAALESLFDVADAAPSDFVAATWEWLVGMVEGVRHEGNSVRYGYDYVLGTRHLERDLPTAIATALETWAKDNPGDVPAFVNQWKKTESVSIHRFLIAGMIAAGDAATTTAFEYLVEDERRLNVGEPSEIDEASAELIRMIAPKLSLEQRAQLRQRIEVSRMIETADRSDDDMRKIEGYNEAHRLRLLRELGTQDLPEETIAAIERLPKDRSPNVEGAFVMGSPLTPADIIAMSDDALLALYKEWPDSRTASFDERVGGAIELARAFGEAAKTQPQRFLDLLPNFEPGRTELPVVEGLRSLAEVLPLSGLEEAILRLHSKAFLRSQDHQGTAAYALERASRSKEQVSPEMLALLESWLVDVASKRSVSATKPRTSQPREPASLLWSMDGGGSLPGGNYPILYALTLGYLRNEKPDVEAWRDVLTRHLEREEQPIVWQAMGRFLTDSVFGDGRRAEPFVDRLFERFPEVRDSHDGLVIIARSMHRLPMECVSRWMNGLEEGQWPLRHQAVGELLVLLATRKDAPRWARERMEREILAFEATAKDDRGTVLGMTFAAAHLWNDPIRRQTVTDVLVRITELAKEPIALAVMEAFRYQRALLRDTPTERMLAALTKNPEVVLLGKGHSFLEDLRDLLPYKGLEIANLLIRVVEHAGTTDRKFLQPRGTELVDIAVTLQHLRTPVRERGLDLFEQLLAAGVREARMTLADLDPSERPAWLPLTARRRAPRKRRRN